MIDLHVHSTASDGHSAPEQVVAEAAAAGMTTIALTDHDTTAGLEHAQRAADAYNVRVVPGVEISCHVRGISVHMLGYCADPFDEALAAMWDATRASRLQRARTIVERLSVDVPIEWADVVAITGEDSTVGRPHIADALVARGVVASREEAFAGLLRAGSPYYARYLSPDGMDVVRAVVAAGGVAVIAHPSARRRGRVIDDADIAALAAAGMAGIEADHRDHTAADRSHLRGLARDLGLVVTGSSDYHGTGKPNRLGEFTTEPAALEDLLDRSVSPSRSRPGT